MSANRLTELQLQLDPVTVDFLIMHEFVLHNSHNASDLVGPELGTRGNCILHNTSDLEGFPGGLCIIRRIFMRMGDPSGVLNSHNLPNMAYAR